MIDIKKEIKKYWDQRSGDYDRSPGHTDLPEEWRKLLSSIFREGARILDVGTGTGFIALILAELGHEVVGVDISERMLDVARKKAEKMNLDVKFRVADAENLPFNDEEFDAVVCRHVLWTLPNPRKALEEWGRVVKSGGKVVIIDGNWGEDGALTTLKRIVGKLGIAIYERRLPKNAYKKEIREKLPFYRSLTVEKVAELMRETGLTPTSIKDLSWIRRQILERKPVFYKLIWSARSYFLIEGVKV